jgi:8-oxo-dGTP diphosphatase
MSITRKLFPLVLVDIALFSVDQRGLRVLLVRRAEEPEKGRWGLPGGILKPDLDASLQDAALRVLREKVAVEIPHLEEVRTFSGPDRDARGWSVSVLFYALLPRSQIEVAGKKKVEAMDWADAVRPGQELAFDHAEQLGCALASLRDKVERHALPLHLMPEKFTLTDLQRTCEAILGWELDKSVFRRRLKGSEDLVELGEFERGAKRPAQLWKAKEGFEFGV